MLAISGASHSTMGQRNAYTVNYTAHVCMHTLFIYIDRRYSFHSSAKMSEPRLLKLPNEVLDAILAYLPRIELNSLRAAGRELKSQVERYAQQSTAENDTTSDEPSRDREEAYTIDGLAQATQLEESSEEAQAADVIRLEVWDRTTSKSAAIALRKERDEMVDAWCSEYVERRMGHVSKSNADLVSYEPQS